MNGCFGKKPGFAGGVFGFMVLLCGALPCHVAAESTPETNVVTGVLSSDRTWSGNYLLEGEITVAAGVTLKIEAGSRVMMDTDASLRVEGRLQANGLEEIPIHFTRARSGVLWKQILFVNAEQSQLHHCVFEYADSAGDHKDYYDDDCNPETAPPARQYHEAVVVLASHVELHGCTFRNLPDARNGEGDAIAVIADDPEHPGPASAQIIQCDFIGIGQGVHTRFAYVLVEDCYFTGHNGDNDDVDLYGESVPPPMIRNNLFLNPNHDDMINPTRCSAVIMGNVIAGSDDHGVVLRGKCSPIMINNLIYNCSSAGIAVQNQCDALLLNNTIVNCGRGVRFFDHTGRWDPPYCLFPGSGKATLINCIIWDCPDALVLTDSPYPEDRGSHASVYHSIIQGGQSGASVSANSTLTWGPGNRDADPRLGFEHRLTASSPGIDNGTPPATVDPAFAELLSDDLDGVPRPLDGDGNGTALVDIGAFEFLLDHADSNQDGIPDGWTWQFGLDPAAPGTGEENPDEDPHTTYQEWMADTDPTDPDSWFRIEVLALDENVEVSFPSSTNRVYTLYHAAPLEEAGMPWQPVPGRESVPGTGAVDRLTDVLGTAARSFYRVGVSLK